MDLPTERGYEGRVWQERQGLTLHDFTEDDVFSIQVRRRGRGDKELGAVGVLPRVGHGEEERLGVIHREGLVLEFFAVDGLSACSKAQVTCIRKTLNPPVPLPAVKSPPWHMNLGPR